MAVFYYNCFFIKAAATDSVAMDDHVTSVLFDVGLSEREIQSRPSRPMDPCKLFLGMLLDTRVYCTGLMKSVAKAAGFA